MFVRTGLKVWCVGLVVMGASVAYGSFTWEVGFEIGEGFDDGFAVIWQYPQYSGTTVQYNQNADPAVEPDGIKINQTDEEPWNSAQVVSMVAGYGPIAFTGDRSYEILFVWGNPPDTDIWPDPPDTGTNDFVRCTTSATAHLNRPSVQLNGKITFRLAAVAWSDEAYEYLVPDATILMVAGITETGRDLPMGAPDTGGGDIEWVYPDGADDDGVIPDTNGLLPDPPFPGGLRIHTLDHFPPVKGSEDDWQLITIDLGNPVAVKGFASNGVDPLTAGDGVLDATAVGDHVNRGAFESLGFTNDPEELEGRTFAIYIDDVVIESDVADPAQPPTIQSPVYDTDTEVVVNCDSAAEGGEEARLFINDISVGTADIVGTQATFGPFGPGEDLGELMENDILKATQTVYGDESGFSLPVRVTAEGVLMADDFELYQTEEQFNAFWHNSISSPIPSNAYVHWTMGSAASCDHLLKEANPSGADAARLWQYIGHQNGTDEEPLVVTWKFQHHGATTPSGERTKFELARQASDTFSATAAARLPGTTGIVLENGPASVPLPETWDQYEILLMSDDDRTMGSNGIFVADLPTTGSATNGFFIGNQGNVALTGIDRVSDEWHEMQIIVTDNYINYKIDGEDANPTGTNGQKTFSADGVPRPNGDYYNFIIIGQGYSNNGPTMMYDDISITVGDTEIPFEPANPVPSPDVVSPLIPGDTLVNVINIESNAVQVAVYVNGENPVTSNGPFLDYAATLTVPALDNGDEVSATQTLDVVARVETESCLSLPVVVGVPAVTVEGPLVPTQTTVEVSDVEDTASAVKVYRVLDPVTKQLLGSFSPDPPNPVTVDVSANPLQNDWEIVATQVIAGTEGPDSDSVIVAVPAPTLPGPLAVGDTVVTVTDVHPLASRVTVYVDGTTNGFINTSGVTEVDVDLDSALFVNEEVWATQTIAGIESPPSNVITTTVTMCLIAFEDDFDTDTSALWNVITEDKAGPPDDADATFAWDYGSNAGIPPAPNGSGTTFGLKLEANQVDAGAVPETASVTVSPVGLGPLSTNGYRLVFDMWINVNSELLGSTEFYAMGVGYDGVTPNLAEGNGYSTDAYSGDGGWYAISGECGAAQDVRAYLDVAVQAPETGQFAAGTDVTAQYTDANALYLNLFGTPSAPEDQTALDPDQSGDLREGSAGFAWHQVDLTVVHSKARWSINDTPIVTLDAPAKDFFQGNVWVGYMDVFDSVSTSPEWSFGLADNVRVLVHHTPGTDGDFDGDSGVDLDDFRYFADCLAGPNVEPEPSTGPNCINVCLEVFDSDDDGDVDLKDFAHFQDQF